MIFPYIGVLFLLFALTIPVAFALGGTSIIVTILERGFDFNPAFMVQKAVSGLDNFLLLSVPFFIFTGKMMNAGGITLRIFNFASAVVGSMRGGLAQVNVFASILFAGMSGTAVSDAAGLGTVQLNAMRKAGYDDVRAGYPAEDNARNHEQEENQRNDGLHERCAEGSERTGVRIAPRRIVRHDGYRQDDEPQHHRDQRPA